MEEFSFSTTRLPDMCRAQRVGALFVGEKAYIGDEALWIDDQWRGWVDTDALLASKYNQPDVAQNIPVYRLHGGFVVDLAEHCELENIPVEAFRAIPGRCLFMDEDDEPDVLSEVSDEDAPVIGFITSAKERKAFLEHYKDILMLSPKAHRAQVEKSSKDKKSKGKAAGKKRSQKHSAVEE